MSFLNEIYLNLKPYTPGEQLNDKNYIKLNTNENPYGVSEKAKRYAEEEIAKSRLYPDPENSLLAEKIAEYYRVDKNQVIITNGSDEVLYFIFAGFFTGNKKLLFPNITYGFYRVYADFCGVNYYEVPLKADFTINTDDYTKGNANIIIANPNAPTGIYLGLSEIEKIIMADTKSLVVIDEAYIDFGGNSCIELVEKYDNLIVVQTFSKSRQLAGARVGFAISNEKNISDLKKIKYSINPYNVNRVSEAMARGAIEDKEYFDKTVQKIIETREGFVCSLREKGFLVLDSYTNFVFAKHDKIKGKVLYSMLRDRGFLVRHFDTALLTDFIRISIGKKEDMMLLINEIENILKEVERI
ncbi:MAG: histidinol-phosphate transaminase [Christensenellaceae bacterium]|nr:histidinol-phosphate transaminase [Christensenellaceae bacterium]